MLVARDPRFRLVSAGTPFGVAAFLALAVAMLCFGMSLFESSRSIAVLLLSPVGTIGRYPAGPDVPFDGLHGGASAWALSVVPLIFAGLVLGALLRRRA